MLTSHPAEAQTSAWNKPEHSPRNKNKPKHFIKFYLRWEKFCFTSGGEDEVFLLLQLPELINTKDLRFGFVNQKLFYLKLWNSNSFIHI